jgi:hypothetical protein
MSATARCENHPDTEAVRSCDFCGAAICETCTFTPRSGQRKLCPVCFADAGGRPTATTRSRPPPAANCTNHPGIPASVACQACGAPVCATCTFEFPDGGRYCPECVSRPQPAMSDKAKTMVWLALGLALFATLTSIIFFATAAMEALDEVGELAFGPLVLLPTVVGLGLGVSARDRRRKTSPMIWAAILWNGGLLALLLLATCAGLFMV